MLVYKELMWLRSEVLNRRPQHYLVDVDIGRLLNSVRDGASDRTRGDRLPVELHHEFTARLVDSIELELTVYGTRLYDRHADLATDFTAQAF
jgi:hypothetical protein